MRRLMVGLALVTGLVAAPPVAAPAGAIVDIVAGACVFNDTLTVTYSPPATVVPRPTDIVISGSGTCAVNQWTGTAHIYLTMNSMAFSCAGGVAVGAASFSIGAGPFGGFFSPSLVMVENVGGVLHMTAAYNVATFNADGAFVHNPLSAPSCATGLGSTTLTGGFGFQDPVVHDPPPLEG